MLDVGQTAEEFLADLQDRLYRQADALDSVLGGLYSSLPEKKRILAMGPLDQAFEMRRTANFLEGTLRDMLAAEIPCADEERG